MVAGLVFWEDLIEWNGGASDSFACFWDPILPNRLPHPALMRRFVTGLIVACCAMLDVTERPAVSWSETEVVVVDLGEMGSGGGRGGVGGGEDVVETVLYEKIK